MKKSPPKNNGFKPNPPPEPPYAGMIFKPVGILLPETPFWFPPGGQHLCGVVIYTGIGSTTAKMRCLRPISNEEYVDDLNISSGAQVMVEEVEYEKQKAVHLGSVHREPGMEGFPEK